MTLTDYLIDISLIAIVLLQVKGRRITTRALLLPVGIVVYVAFTYLRGLPTAGNDLILVLGCAGLGALLGGLAGRFTSVHPDGEGFPVAKAGLAAAALWVLGTGGRLAFQVYATHGGGAAIEHFSASHSITSVAAWTDALILMALSEVVIRTAILGWRSYTVRRQALVASGAAPAPRPSVLSGWRSIMEGSEHSF
jgi:hypothetical protein